MRCRLSLGFGDRRSTGLGRLLREEALVELVAALARHPLGALQVHGLAEVLRAVAHHLAHEDARGRVGHVVDQDPREDEPEREEGEREEGGGRGEEKEEASAIAAIEGEGERDEGMDRRRSRAWILVVWVLRFAKAFV